MAARLVWMLRVTGHDAAVLDGGIQAWTGPLQTRERRRAPARFTARAWPEHLLAEIDEVAATGDVLLDGAPGRALRGRARTTLDPRPGHIPGARGLPTREHVGEDGTLLPARRAPPPVRRGRRAARDPRRLLLRLGRDRLPPAARARARGPRPRPPVPGLLVAMGRRPGAAGRDRRLSAAGRRADLPEGTPGIIHTGVRLPVRVESHGAGRRRSSQHDARGPGRDAPGPAQARARPPRLRRRGGRVRRARARVVEPALEPDGQPLPLRHPRVGRLPPDRVADRPLQRPATARCARR